MDQNSIENINFIVTKEFTNVRLDVFIFQMCDVLPSRSFSAKVVKNGYILVNKKLKKPSFELRENDIVEVDLSFLNLSASSPKAEAIPLDILFEDEHIIVINKAAGMVVHPGAGVSSGTLVNALLHHCGSMIPSLGNDSRAGIVHRLDRDTTGVMVAAKTQTALTFLSEEFATHKQHRVYDAICFGILKEKSGTIETGYGRDLKNRLKYKTFPLGEGKVAKLSYKVLNEVQDLFSLVECTLYTGRTHQIRVQMTSIKHPIVGDALYAHVSDKVRNNKPVCAMLNKMVERQLLHAKMLEITHPITKQRMMFTAPYPKDFEDFYNAISA